MLRIILMLRECYKVNTYMLDEIILKFCMYDFNQKIIQYNINQ